MSAEITVYNCPYCGKLSEKKTCSRCHNLLYARSGYYCAGKKSDKSYYSSQIKEECCVKLLNFQQTRDKKSEEKAAKFIKKESEKSKKTDAHYNAKAINDSKEMMIAYLRAVVRTEGQIYALESVYATLYKKIDNALAIHSFDVNAVKSELTKQKKKATKSESPEKTAARITALVDKTMEKKGIVCPSEPVSPILSEKKVTVPPFPQEPIYEKPGFFNKKKVEAKNAVMRKEYERAINAYESAKKQSEIFERAQKAYDSAMEQYRIEKKEYEKALEDYKAAKSAIEEEITARENSKKADKEAAQKQKAQDLEKEIEQISTEVVKSFPNQKRIDYLEKQKKILEKALTEAIGNRRALYAADIIYQKYRTIVAEASMLEYLESGRCETLTGENGAYNIYESEIRAGIINPLLEQVLLSVETFKISKSVLFMELSRINKFTKNAVVKLEKATTAFKTKDTNVFLAKQWFEEEASVKHTECCIEESAQVKLDDFESCLEKHYKEYSKSFAEFTQLIPTD